MSLNSIKENRISDEVEIKYNGSFYSFLKLSFLGWTWSSSLTN